jgi:ribonuclease-3
MSFPAKINFKQIEKRIGYNFKNRNLLAQALTHSSYAYENKKKVNADNETLEFLGDSVIGLVIADYFFATYPNSTEGDLSKLKATTSNTSSLSFFAKRVNLDKNILLGKGEEKSGGRKKKTILAAAFEALVAAIYLDGGLEQARKFLQWHLRPFLKRIEIRNFLINNYKSALQEYFQKSNLPSPVYRTIMTSGPDHKRLFKVEVLLENEALARAEGNTKKDAQKKAAQIALKKILGRRMKSLTSDTFLLRKKT